MPEPTPQHPDQRAVPAPWHGPDLVTLVAGLGAVGLAATTLLGGVAWLPDVDGRWVIAALALGIGLFLVISSLRPQRR